MDTDFHGHSICLPGYPSVFLGVWVTIHVLFLLQAENSLTFFHSLELTTIQKTHAGQHYRCISTITTVRLTQKYQPVTLSTWARCRSTLHTFSAFWKPSSIRFVGMSVDPSPTGSLWKRLEWWQHEAYCTWAPARRNCLYRYTYELEAVYRRRCSRTRGTHPYSSEQNK